MSLEFFNNLDLHDPETWKTNVAHNGPVFKKNDLSLGIQNRQDYGIGDFIPINRAKNVLIVTRGRSGSSFLGDLLNRYPGTFYTFEPLHHAGKRGILTSQNRINALKQIFNCTLNDEFFEHAKEWKYSLSRNVRYWNFCNGLVGGHHECYLPELFNSICSIFSIRLVKTIRLSFDETEELLKDIEVRNSIKIIFLFQDPRGVHQSMKEICDKPGWKFKNCNDINHLCEVLDKDILGAINVKQKYPSKYFICNTE